MRSEKQVTVIDKDRQFLRYVHAAIARKLLVEGAAVVYSRDPFIIQIVCTKKLNWN